MRTYAEIIQGLRLADRLFWANRTLDLLIDDEAMDSPDWKETCQGDDCISLVDPDLSAQHEGLCKACYKIEYFTCVRCEEDSHRMHMSTRRNHCESCNDDVIREQSEEMWTEIEELTGTWSEESAEGHAKMKKLLAYVKKLSK